MLEWTQVLLSTIGFAVLAVVALLLTFTLILRAVDAKIAPPGDLYWVDGDKYQIHLYCRGNETDSKGNKLPTVLFEGGEDPVEDGLWQFADNALKNGSFSRYCFADRPGFAWVSQHLHTHAAPTIADSIPERHGAVAVLCQPGDRGFERSTRPCR